MASGGARANSGPAPDPNALRRDRKSDAGWTVLPSGERSEVAPEWPLEGASEREMELWRTFWRKPQAILWEKNGQLFEVAFHVRCFAEAEVPAAATPLRTLVRQQADALLLTIPAMYSARVKISENEVAAKRADLADVPASEPRKSSRDRLKVLPGGDGG